MILNIAKFPNKILQSTTQTVEFPLSDEVIQLTKDMTDTVKDADGIGLAAPQVDKMYKLIVVNLEKSGGALFPLYNPKIIFGSKEQWELEEGCLSIPGVFGVLKRPKKVTIQAQNRKGGIIKIIDDGWISRIVQHEVDHTNGILILNHIEKYTQGEDLVKKWKKKRLL